MAAAASSGDSLGDPGFHPGRSMHVNTSSAADIARSAKARSTIKPSCALLIHLVVFRNLE